MIDLLIQLNHPFAIASADLSSTAITSATTASTAATAIATPAADVAAAAAPIPREQDTNNKRTHTQHNSLGAFSDPRRGGQRAKRPRSQG